MVHRKTKNRDSKCENNFIEITKNRYPSILLLRLVSEYLSRVWFQSQARDFFLDEGIRIC